MHRIQNENVFIACSLKLYVALSLPSSQSTGQSVYQSVSVCVYLPVYIYVC